MVNIKKTTQSVSNASKLIKPIFQRFFYPKGYEKCLIIMGCQRSGTTIISRVFDRILYAKVFGEFSILSIDDPNRIRLNNINNVIAQVQKSHSPLIVLKPLVESHKANLLLSQIQNACVLWVFRHYLDVGLSDIKKFSKNPGHSNLLPIINKDKNNWRCENISHKTTSIINSLYSKDLSPLDCACLFWYVRNILFFEQSLDTNSKVFLWDYDKFVQDPSQHIKDLLTKMSLPTVPKKITQDVFINTINRNQKINSNIKELCDDLFDRLSLHTKSLK
ncbi:hypothetical protein RI845_18295 [Thalassotalea nanhaiensis]|uniref:Sulfotransferase domain-containing protein n=1 Tax=Thalassotalea nanhaiensis TaxID=3065648 RepID=A0ABY9TID6_9GAMM|nr:hypothetical protein RI845_18295 [Colwelliaceae bacterium SQ345]